MGDEKPLADDVSGEAGDDTLSGLTCQITGGSSAKILDNQAACMNCEICGFKWKPSQVLNAGTKDSPKYRDRACHSSSRWTDKALQSQKVDLPNMKRTRWIDYRRTVLKFRICSPDDPPELVAKCGCRSLQDRKLLREEYFEVLFKE